MSLIASAIGLGFLLSFVFIGPLFFLVIDTSLTKGWKQALTLSIGAILADLVFILISYFASEATIEFFKTYPIVKTIGGIIIILYGIFMLKLNADDANDIKQIEKTNYLNILFKGFMLSLVNVGVFFFWLFILGWIGQHYPGKMQLRFFIFVTLAAYFLFECVKVFGAYQLKKSLTEERLKLTRRIIQIILVIFGVIIIFKK